MKITKHAAIAAVALCMLTACRTQKVITPEAKTVTVVERTVDYRTDTIRVPIPVESVRNVTPDTLSLLETALAVSEARIEGGLLHHTLSHKPAMLPAPVQTRTERTDSVIEREIPVIVEIPAPLSWHQHLRLNTYLPLLAMLLLTLYRLGKKNFS